MTDTLCPYTPLVLSEGSGLGDRARVCLDPVGGRATALDAIAAQGVLALRGEADVCHHRDAALDELGDHRRHLGAALELDAVRDIGRASCRERGGQYV